MKDDIKRYYELNRNRDKEGLNDWVERVGLNRKIRQTLMRDLKKAGRKDECVFCRGPIETDETYMHSTCLDGQITYKDGVEKNSAAFVYCLYRFGCLVYVGIAQDPRSRFRSHVMEKDVWSMRVIFGGSRREVEALEKQHIHIHFPPLNKRLHDANGRQLLADSLTDKVFRYDEMLQAQRERDASFEQRLRALESKMKSMQMQMDAYENRMSFLESVAFRPVEEDCW